MQKWQITFVDDHGVQSVEQFTCERKPSLEDAAHLIRDKLVPVAADIWKDLVGLKDILNSLTEPRENYLERRNQFLNHLLARFAEQLTDYGLLTVRLSPQKGKERLIGDKLRFLNNYPQIGAERGQGFDYAIP
eukprot:gene5616-6985_t